MNDSPTPPAEDLRRADVLRRRAAHVAEYEALTRDLLHQIDPLVRLRNERQAQSLLAAIAQLDAELNDPSAGGLPGTAPAPDGAAPPPPRPTNQVIVAKKKSRVRDVDMVGGPGSDQQVHASDGSSVERAKLHAARPSDQQLRAEEESEISDVELTDE